MAALAMCWALGASPLARAELPIARLSSIFPIGAQRGGRVEVELAGADLDGVRRLNFSHPGISATLESAQGSAPKFQVRVDPSVPAGWYDVRAEGLFGVTDPRTFEVCDGPTLVAEPGNATAAAAVDVPLGASVYGAAEANASQFYRVAAKAQRTLWITVVSTQLDSRMVPVAIVSDSSGREIGRGRSAADVICVDPPVDGNCFVRVHDVLYRGGPEFGYRLRVTDSPPPTEAGAPRWPCPPAGAFLEKLPGDPNRPADPIETGRSLTAPCEVRGQFRSFRQRDVYTLDVAPGTAYRIEIVSQRIGQSTSPFLLVQRVESDGTGAEKFVDVQEVYAAAAPVSIPEFPLGHLDPVYRLDAKQAGRYRLLVRDLYARDRAEAPAAYRLSIRPESPGFELVAIAQSPLPEPADSKDVPIWTALLRRGGTAPIRVVAVRRDGFTGPIALHVERLPPGVTAGPAVIPEGASTATLILQAGDDARSWVGPIQITGVGHTPAGDLCRPARAGTVSFSAYDTKTKSLLLLRSRLCDQFVIAVCDAEPAPISVTPTRRTFEASAGGKAALAFDVKAHAEFTSPIVLNLAGHASLVKQLTIDPKSARASVDLDLTQAKLPPGDYTLHFVGQAKLKYPDSPDLRQARIAILDAEDRQAIVSQATSAAAGAFVEAIQSMDFKRATDTGKALLLSELNQAAGRQSLADAWARAADVAAHAPARQLATSIDSGAFDLKIDPAAKQ